MLLRHLKQVPQRNYQKEWPAAKGSCQEHLCAAIGGESKVLGCGHILLSFWGHVTSCCGGQGWILGSRTSSRRDTKQIEQVEWSRVLLLVLASHGKKCSVSVMYSVDTPAAKLGTTQEMQLLTYE